ncbi:fibronectin type III domain-containing protein [Reichenbachiella carrageenanivorans]|uniref:Fibronectin type III domain-containing protein n=1 Tax=Reichenbachiella carrageenanivorans TaxID=2979869 RepID=A0ABY6CXH8_9BACT|nr:fibronectin type III domain-containing protein [Reichenbachiella carrageenanivorans]UXX78622.1 fibronectin type III domain-containing protein [Reichenbachiella carrageenanivorans]
MTTFLLFSFLQLAQPSAIQFTNQDLQLESNSGYIQLDWTAVEGSQYILQRSMQPDFTNSHTIYQGPDHASFVSGLDNGTYYYRVGDDEGHWSDTLTLKVEHQSMPLALTLFGLGFVVFAFTVFVVIKGVYTTSQS